MSGPIGGTMTNVVNRRAVPEQVTAEERRDALAMLEQFAKSRGMTADGIDKFPESKPVIDHLFADDAGRAWVQLTSRADSGMYFDVFDPTGHPLVT